ncbi:BgtE-20046 [Blumeria graminis f. sp. tritici]|uniref:BgtE-20046 n=2 Tax=Blumeria graminis f. sp. tritici TaxID=62690 RepID=A0A381LI38_BLUGR|nr:BgtE-20046 [Blumeria graminis f. sp. tritici]
MKILSAISASTFPVLLLLGTVVQGNVLKCATGKEFDNRHIGELASQAEYQYNHHSYPLGPDGRICKAHEFDIPLAHTRATISYLVQVCESMEGYRLYEWYNSKWVICE